MLCNIGCKKKKKNRNKDSTNEQRNQESPLIKLSRVIEVNER